MEQDRNRTAHRCQCPDCKRDRGGRLAGQHAAIIAFLAILDERDRRLMAAFLARQEGRGGIAQIARISGLSRNTIRRGLRELTTPDALSSPRIRRPGGGRKRSEKKIPTLRAGNGGSFARHHRG